MIGPALLTVAMVVCGAAAVGVVVMLPAIVVAGLRGQGRRSIRLVGVLVALTVVAAVSGIAVGMNPGYVSF